MQRLHVSVGERYAQAWETKDLNKPYNTAKALPYLNKVIPLMMLTRIEVIANQIINDL